MTNHIHIETLSKDISFEMIPIEGGTFRMGDEVGDLWDTCRPLHQVTVGDFHIGKYPVTQALWKAVMGEENNPSFFIGDQRPVEQVSWDNAQVFLQKLNALTGRDYRLPTEAEWEFAARGGKKGRGHKYAGSDKLKEVGWFDDNSHGETKPVGLKDPNELDIFDMSGNVWEWCEDWFGSDYYKKCEKQGIVENPRGPETGSARVYRGGGWFDDARSCRAARRNRWHPAYRYSAIGFRLALSLQSVG
ncbi:MAG TPA: formylglycine-generating enzyme family protein [Saprospiraceae bacterium]|nr:formylglycine-generating enzyme family protein [Saprospiraceae bacterium]